MRYTYRLLLSSAAALMLAAFPACDQDDGPEKPCIEKPDNPDNPDNPGDSDKTELDKPGSSEYVVYYDNFDKADCNTAVWFNNGPAYWNPSGSGSGSLDYSQSSYSRIGNSFRSQDYPGASGRNSVYFTAANGYARIGNIVLPEDKRVYRLTLGINNPGNGNTVVFGRDISIYVADDNSSTEEQELKFTQNSYGKWVLATSIFEISSADTKAISLRIKAIVTNMRIDDVRLEITDRTPTQSFSFGPAVVHDYVERPKALVSKAEYKYIDHRAETYLTHKKVRNYEACYDTQRHNPIWVAFPTHDIYNEGGWTRPKRDPWRPDPNMTDAEQSIIYDTDWNSWPNNTFRFWGAAFNSYSGWSMGRGHLMASSDRGCGNKEVLLDLNTQTFYPTNIAPERYVNDTGGGEINDSHWAMVETCRREKWKCSDTLYVVVGCVYEYPDWIVYDNAPSGTYIVYDDTKACAIPSARYVIVLRTKNGNTGKAVWDCREDELMSIGFWFPQKVDRNLTITELPPLKDYIYSVSEIEKMAGNEFDFFPEAPAAVKTSYNIDDWPGLRAIAD